MKALSDDLRAAVLLVCRAGLRKGVADAGWDDIRRGLMGPVDTVARTGLDDTLFMIVEAEMRSVNAERPG